MLKLENFTEADVSTVLEWASTQSEAEFRLWAGHSSYNPHTLEENLKKTLLDANKDPLYDKMFKAVDSADDSMIGHVQLFIDPKNDLAYIARVIIDSQKRGKGFGKAMIKELLKYGFEVLNLNLLALTVENHNISAIKCYDSCGFVNEGLARQRRKNSDGTYSSSFIMSILKSEYLQNK